MLKERQEDRKKLSTFTPVYDARQDTLLGYLADLTLQGAKLVGESPMEVGQHVLLAIACPETGELGALRLRVPARAAWCRQDETPQYFNIGFEFQETSQENKKVIEAVVERYQLRCALHR